MIAATVFGRGMEQEQCGEVTKSARLNARSVATRRKKCSRETWRWRVCEYPGCHQEHGRTCEAFGGSAGHDCAIKANTSSRTSSKVRNIQLQVVRSQK